MLVFSRLSTGALWVVIVILSATAAWLLGRYQGDQQCAQLVAEWQNQLQVTTGQCSVDVALNKKNIAHLTHTRDLAQSKASQLQIELSNGFKQSFDDAAELALYRRIAGEKMPKGLLVDTITRHDNGDTSELEVTLVLSHGRDRVKGVIGVTLIYAASGKNIRRSVVNAKTGELKEFDADNVLTTSHFNLRFFQTLLVNVGDVTTIDPEYVEISITPEGRPYKPTSVLFHWNNIRETDVR